MNLKSLNLTLALCCAFFSIKTCAQTATPYSVLGQPNYNTSTAPTVREAKTFSPTSIAVFGNKLYVGDDKRVLRFPGLPTTQANAEAVFGQKNFTEPTVGGSSRNATLPNNIIVGYMPTYGSWYFNNPGESKLAKLSSYVNVVLLAFLRPDVTYTKGNLDVVASQQNVGFEFGFELSKLKTEIDLIKKNKPGVRIMASVGGATYTNWDAFLNGGAEKIKDLVDDLGLDGINLDYENLATSAPTIDANGNVIAAQHDVEIANVIDKARATFPKGQYILGYSALHVTLYGQGDYKNSLPSSLNTGLNLNAFKTKADKLDFVDFQAYDAGTYALTGYGKLGAGSYTVTDVAYNNPSSYLFNPIEGLKSCLKAVPSSTAVVWGFEIPAEGGGSGNLLSSNLAKNLADTLVKIRQSYSNLKGFMLWDLAKLTSGSFPAGKSASDYVTNESICQLWAKTLNFSNYNDPLYQTQGLNGSGGGLDATTITNPTALYAGSQLFVGDASNSRVIRFSSADVFTNNGTSASADMVFGETSFSATGTPDWNRLGTGQPQLNKVSGIWATATKLYGVLPQNNTIVRYQIPTSGNNTNTLDALFGHPVAAGTSSAAPSANTFNAPMAVLVDEKNDIMYVADKGNNRVLRFRNVSTFHNYPVNTWDSWSNFPDADFAFGQSNLTTATAGSKNNQLNAPIGLALDTKGNLYVLDSGNQRILRFANASTVSANPTADLIVGGGTGTTNNLFNSPNAIAVDGDYLYVSDGGNNRVIIYKIDNSATQPAKTTQSITFNTLPAKTVGDANFTLTATASSNLPVSYTSSNTAVATISGSTVTIVGAGTTNITASQAGDNTYSAATNVVQSLTVNNAAIKTAQSITFNALPEKTVGDANFTLTATASSNLPVSYTSSNTAVATISGSTVTIVGAGTTNITASQAGDNTYNTATNVVQSLTVNKGNSSANYALSFDFQDQSWGATSLTIKLINKGADEMQLQGGSFVYNTDASIGSTYENWTSQTTNSVAYPNVNLVQQREKLNNTFITQVISTLAFPTESWAVTKLKPTESVGIITSISKLLTQAEKDAIINSGKFYLATQSIHPTATISVNVTGTDGNNASIVISDLVSNSKQTIQASPGSQQVDLIVDHDYNIWSSEFLVSNKSYTPAFTQSSPKYLAAVAGNEKIDFNFTSASLQYGTLSLNVTGLGQSKNIKATLTRNDNASITQQATITKDGSTSFASIPYGTYTLHVDAFTDNSLNQIYTPNYSETINIASETQNTAVAFNTKGYSEFKVPGWPKYLSMGSVTSADASVDALFYPYPVDVIFKYAGNDGAGDRGTVLEATITKKTIEQARRLEANYNANGFPGHKVMPLMILYTANASGSPSEAIKDFNDATILQMHYQNIIKEIKESLSHKDAEHPYPASYLLSPDLLGGLQQNSLVSGTSGDDPLTGVFDINGPLRAAYTKEGVEIPSNMPSFEQNIKGYFQSVNYLFHVLGQESIVFGWQENLWSTGSSSWIHDFKNPDAPKQNATSMVNFINDKLGVYSGQWKPHYLAFDRYERDDFAADGRPNYAFNATDWSRFVDFCDHMAKSLAQPAMLWQIPGGHMPTVGENDVNYSVTGHSSSAAPYFLGDTRIGTNLDNIKPELLNLNLQPSVYDGAQNVKEWLQKDNGYNWSKSNLQDIADKGIFSIIWGGGSTTSVIPIGSNGDDDGWLGNKILAYQSSKVYSSVPTVLATKISDFTTSLSSQGAKLTWHVAEEDDAISYVLSKSDDGKIFKNIAEVKGDSRAIYNYTDRTFDKSAYYKLSIIDVNHNSSNDGDFIRYVKALDGNDVYVYPNPAVNYFQLNIPQVTTEISVEILDVNSKLLKSIKVNDATAKIEVQDLPTGIYILRIITPGTTYTKKLYKK